jgi:hypothetical protein
MGEINVKKYFFLNIAKVRSFYEYWPSYSLVDLLREAQPWDALVNPLPKSLYDLKLWYNKKTLSLLCAP